MEDSTKRQMFTFKKLDTVDVKSDLLKITLKLHNVSVNKTRLFQ